MLTRPIQRRIVSYFLASVVILLGPSGFARGEAVTPLSAGIREQTELFVTCALTEAPRIADIPLYSVQKEADFTTGTYHYRLWVPKGYLAQPARRWPCVFVAAPGGNAGMGAMAPLLKSRGYIVVMLVESENGPWEPCVGNFLAAHDDVVKRLRVAEGEKIATGFSGGARACSIFVQIRAGFCGLIMQGAAAAGAEGKGYFTDRLQAQPSLFVAITMGDNDSRQSEIRQMETRLDSARLFVARFKGGHQWAPLPTIASAFDWIETKAGVRRKC